MSVTHQNFKGINLLGTGPIFFNSDLTLSISSQVANSLTISTSAISAILNIVSNGQLLLTSVEASSWNVTGADLTLKTTTSGNVILSGASDVSIDSSNNVIIGTTNAMNVAIGRSGQSTTVGGNLTIQQNLVVIGTTTTIDTTHISVGESLITLNAGADGTDIDGGLLINRSISALTPTVTGKITLANTTNAGSPNSINLSNLDLTSKAGSLLKITAGGTSFTNQTTSIQSIAGTQGTSNYVATLNSNWTPIPIALTSGSFVISGTTGTMKLTATTSTALNANADISVGASIMLTIGSVTQYYVVSALTSATILALTNGNLITGTSTTASVVSPGVGYTYSVYNDGTICSIWHEATQRYVIGNCTASSGSFAVTVDSYADFQANNGYFASITATTLNITTTNITDITKAVTSNDTSVTGGALTVVGGIGSSTNALILSSGISTATQILDVRQTSATNLANNAVANFTQAANQTSVIQFQASSNGLTGAGGSNSIYTLVQNSGGLASEDTAFMRVNVIDANSGLVTGTYYIPLMTLTGI